MDIFQHAVITSPMLRPDILYYYVNYVHIVKHWYWAERIVVHNQALYKHKIKVVLYDKRNAETKNVKSASVATIKITPEGFLKANARMKQMKRVIWGFEELYFYMLLKCNSKYYPESYSANTTSWEEKELHFELQRGLRIYK